MKQGTYCVALLMLLALGLTGVRAAEPGERLSFKEVYDLVKEHLVEVKEAEIDDAAARGLIQSLNPRVTLVSGDGSSEGEGTEGAVAWTTVYDGAFGYVRVGRVETGLSKSLSGAIQGMLSTNKLQGLVLDLRYTGGMGYGAAAAAADLFFSVEKPMIDFGEGVKNSSSKEKAVTLPLTVLVNGETGAAAEALAGILREGGVALLLGGATAGHASISKEFELKGGQKLRIATASIKVGDGKVLERGGITPDIVVDVSAEDGRAHYEDPYADLKGRDGVEPRRRLNEAELVRQRRELEDDPPVGEEEVVVKRILRDPVLGRALDLLKGIAVVKRYRSI